MIAIGGFSHDDWSVRNSSLAMYSSIVRRIFDMKDEDQSSIKNSMNIVQFFLRAPNLINYFFEEINSYLNSEEKQQNMYPTLYPICLILSKLLPYDMKDDLNLIDKQAETEREEVEVQFKESRVITTQEIRQFYTL